MHPEDLEIGTLDDSLWPMLFCNFMELITAFFVSACMASSSLTLPSPEASHNPSASRLARLPGCCSLLFPETRSRHAWRFRG